VRLTSIIYGGQIKKDEMGGACSMHGGYEKCMNYRVLIRKAEGEDFGICFPI
jgi:hypothetical protein